MCPSNAAGPEAENKQPENTHAGSHQSATEHATAPDKERLRAYRLTIAYDGTDYFGWQRQPHHPTVQSHVEAAVRSTLGDDAIQVYASSRTDTGVHAIGQSAMLRTTLWPAEADKLPFALNTRLPLNIVVRDAVEVPLDFHPLRHSTGKRYRYQVYCARKGDPLHARTHWWIRQRVDLGKMRAAAERFVGEHDFFSFQSAGSPRENTVRHVRSLTIEANDHMDGKLYFVDIEANGFLYNMVRNIVGTIVQVGVGREQPDWITQVLDAHDRSVAGAAAPPQGLCLMEVLF